jgi:hypothetical protein
MSEQIGVVIWINASILLAGVGGFFAGRNYERLKKVKEK